MPTEGVKHSRELRDASGDLLGERRETQRHFVAVLDLNLLSYSTVKDIIPSLHTHKLS